MAKNFAYIDAGVSPEEVQSSVAAFEFSHGQFVCDIDFTANGIRYDYDVKASDGTILSSERDVMEAATIPPQADETGKDKAAEEEKKQEDTKNSYISVDEAKSKAVKNAGVSLSDVMFSKAKLEEEDGRMVYEMEFYTAKTEYDCEIDAMTGKILESSRESLVHETSKNTEADDSDGENRPAARNDSSAVRNGNDRSDTNPSRKPVNQTRKPMMRTTGTTILMT